jgi:hypothetical protein
MAQKKPAKIEIGGQKFKIGNAVGSGEFRAIAEATGRPLSDLRERILNKRIFFRIQWKELLQTK